MGVKISSLPLQNPWDVDLSDGNYEQWKHLSLDCTLWIFKAENRRRLEREFEQAEKRGLLEHVCLHSAEYDLISRGKWDKNDLLPSQEQKQQLELWREQDQQLDSVLSEMIAAGNQVSLWDSLMLHHALPQINQGKEEGDRKSVV